MHQIPSDNHIRDLLEPVEPKQVFPVFEEILQVLEQQGQLQSFRSFAGNLLMAMAPNTSVPVKSIAHIVQPAS